MEILHTNMINNHIIMIELVFITKQQQLDNNESPITMKIQNQHQVQQTNGDDESSQIILLLPSITIPLNKSSIWIL